MTIQEIVSAAEPTQIHEKKLTLLVVDDSRMQRKIVSANLKRWGFTVFEAASGVEALEICKSETIDMVLSDWVMPEMDGLEFCEAFRKLPRERYGYFILLTSKSEKNEVARGLEIGADDFLSKPVNSAELRARITAGRRVLDMEDKVHEQKAVVDETLSELQKVYDDINKDLIEAEKFQHSLMPETEHTFKNGRVSMMLQSSGHVGGDIAGFFSFHEDHLGVYSIDVSGHGISSALMTARLAAYFSAHNQGQNVAYKLLEDGSYGLQDPGKIAEILNDRLLQEIDTELYFTLAYTHVNLLTGVVDMVQAGHPHPVVFNAAGDVAFQGTGGPPIGLVPDVPFETVQFTLKPNDRLFLHSDGLTECQNRQDVLLDEDGLERILKKHSTGTGKELLADIVWELNEFTEGAPFGDDLSVILFEFDG